MNTLALPYKSFWWREILRKASTRIMAQRQDYGIGNAVVNDRARTEGAKVTGVTTIVNCTFNAPDTTPLILYPWTDPFDIRPGANQWTSSTGDHIVYGNVATRTAVTARIDLLDCGVSDCTLLMDIFTGDAGAGINFISVRFREISATQRWRLDWTTSTNQIRLFDTNGISTLRASASCPFVSNSYNRFRVILSGSNIYCALEDTLSNVIASVSYSSSLFATITNHGFTTSMTGLVVASWVDNFLVTVP